MSVTFHIPGFLRQFTSGQAEVTVEPSKPTVRDALDALFQGYPELRDRIFTERHEVRPHVNIFVGEESIRFLRGLESSVRSGELITILPAVSGGS